MTTILLIRHGDCGPARLPGPDWDPPLTPSARARLPTMARLARRMVPEALVLASDMRRCATIGRCIARLLRAPLRLESALREQDFGDWCGRSWEDIAPVDSAALWADPVAVAPPGGESFAACAQRAAACVRAALSAGAPALCVVAHAGPLRGIAADLLGLDGQAALALAWDRGAATALRLTGDRALLIWHNQQGGGPRAQTEPGSETELISERR